MVQFNFSERTIKAKVVYYGPPQSGKTTNLEQIHRISDPEGANRLISLNTAQDRTLFFDLLPFSLGSVSGYDFKIQLYTVPGQVQYNATRRVVLAGADAVVFVADAHRPMAKENQAAFENMKVNLLANRLVPEKVPLVFQYNKQDLEPRLAREELDRALNFWGRKAFPAVASRGEGVMETFVAVVQDMLSAIAVKYNLKEKGLDPEAVPAIVAEAFADIARRVAPRGSAASAPAPAAPAKAASLGGVAATGMPAPAPPAPVPPTPSAASPAPVSAPASPAKIVFVEPDGVEPAYPGQVGPEVNPVSEELLNRAIRANLELAQALSQIVRDMGEGLTTLQNHVGRLAAPRDEAHRAHTVAAIEVELRRLQGTLRELAQPNASRPGSARAPGPPQTPPTPPRGTTAPSAAAAAQSRPAPAAWAAAAGAAPSAGPQQPAAAMSPPRPPTPAPPPTAPQPAAPAAGAAPAQGAPVGLDALVAEVALAVRPALQARPVTLESRIVPGAAMPRCSPASLRRALAGLFQGLAAVVAPGSAVVLRAERKPVLLRNKDGSEGKRDFLMLAATHAGGLEDTDQQRILRGGDTGPLGEMQRLVREMGGFLRFAPLPGGALETRLFLPAF
jgi:signal recognition particle receptor subunit beta